MSASEAGSRQAGRRVSWATALIPPVVAVVLLAAWLAYRQQEFDRLTSEVKIAETDVANLPMLETHLEAARKSAIALSSQSSDNSAEADLLERVRSATAAIGVRPQELELLPAADLGTYHRLGVNLHAVIDSDRLIAFFKVIEESRPTLWIDELSASSVSATASSLPANLNVSMSIFMLRCNLEDCQDR
jgi:Tfp pilus assembly protein PilO